MTSKHLRFLFPAFFILAFSNTQAQDATVRVTQDERIPELLKLKSQMTQDNELTDRYKIQILGYGDLSRANSILSRYKSKVGEWPASIEYQSPNYKVWVGNFRNRLEADRALMRVQRSFPNAFVFQPKE